jgi:hypothetical protein
MSVKLSGACRDDEQISGLTVGDKGFRAVEHVVVPVAHRGGPDAGQVAAGARFGHRDADHRLSGDDTGQPALLLLGRGQVGEIGQHDIVLQRQRDGLGRRPGPLQFVDDDRVVTEVLDTRSAEFLGHRKGQQPKLAGLGEQ